MFTDFYATDVKPAGELRASDRVVIWDDIYKVDYYSVIAKDTVKLWVTPENAAEGNLPLNPLCSMTVHRNYSFELAPE